MLLALVLCFYADYYPQGGGSEQLCLSTTREVDTVKDWSHGPGLDGYHDRGGYMEAGYRDGDAFVVLYRAYYVARSHEAWQRTTNIVVDTDIVFASSNEAPVVHTAWDDWRG